METRVPVDATIVTDGSCLGNPGPGGWAYSIRYRDGRVVKGSGSDPETTNNRMELTALLRALERLEPETRYVQVVTDSQWLAFCASGKWKRRANLDLWKRFEELARGKKIDWIWQERNVTEDMRDVDERARGEAQRRKKPAAS
ncbi:MAG: ribonuclease H [Candidatus Binatia bacterium]|nr:MAG: ribonuclease H [Candidatus Binatia bacterium]